VLISFQNCRQQIGTIFYTSHEVVWFGKSLFLDIFHRQEGETVILRSANPKLINTLVGILKVFKHYTKLSCMPVPEGKRLLYKQDYSINQHVIRKQNTLKLTYGHFI
jgi:hypothetical protein